MWVTMARGATKIQCNKGGEVPVRTGNQFLVHRLCSLSYLRNKFELVKKYNNNPDMDEMGMAEGK